MVCDEVADAADCVELLLLIDEEFEVRGEIGG